MRLRKTIILYYLNLISCLIIYHIVSNKFASSNIVNTRKFFNGIFKIRNHVLSFTDMWPKFAFLGLVIIRLMVSANPDAKRLYDDLLSSYNKLVRPVVNTSDVLRVSIKLKLSQLIDVVRTQYIYCYLFENSAYLL